MKTVGLVIKKEVEVTTKEGKKTTKKEVEITTEEEAK